jgi:hypothetical protein
MFAFGNIQQIILKYGRGVSKHKYSLLTGLLSFWFWGYLIVGGCGFPHFSLSHIMFATHMCNTTSVAHALCSIQLIFNDDGLYIKKYDQLKLPLQNGVKNHVFKGSRCVFLTSSQIIKQACELCKENFVWDKSKDYTNNLATVSSSKSGSGKLSNLIKINHRENGLVSIQDNWLNK